MTAAIPTSRPLEACIESVAFWSPHFPHWQAARDAIRSGQTELGPAATRPSPALLAPTERRRAPDTVAIALEVASQACRDAKRSPHELHSVFASTHGDLAISDYLCATLAATPELISPTKFHNSVHNAAAGYWSIGSGTHTPYTAISAHEATFGTGLLEAVSQLLCGEHPVLYVAYDVEARGPLATIVQSRGLFAAALVLSSQPSARGRCITLRIKHDEQSPPIARPSTVLDSVSGSALASAAPFFDALARPDNASLTLKLGSGVLLDVALRDE